MPTTSDTELQSRFRELISRTTGAHDVISIIMDEMGRKFFDNPSETLIAAEQEYKNRIRKTMDELGRPEAPISLFYSPSQYRISPDESLINQLKDMKEIDYEWYSNVVKKVGLTLNSPVEEVARAVSAAANEKETQDANSI